MDSLKEDHKGSIKNNKLILKTQQGVRSEKVHKKYAIKGKLKFEDFKNCLEASQLENKISHLEKSKIDVDSLEEDHKEFIKQSTNIKNTTKT